MITINGLQKKYKSQIALNIPELIMETDTISCVVGNNGAGKTTFFKLLLNLIPTTSGYIEIFGRKIQETENWKDAVSCFLDESFLIDFLTVEEYFDFIIKINEINIENYFLRLKTLEKFFSNEILNKKKFIRNFSTGNKYKIGIAGALMNAGKLIVLDEPFAHLDPSSQIELAKIIENINETEGIGFLISSHNLEQVIKVANKIILFEKGEVIKNIGTNENSLNELKYYFSL